jgi:hypothetical protein
LLLCDLLETARNIPFKKGKEGTLNAAFTSRQQYTQLHLNIPLHDLQITNANRTRQVSGKDVSKFAKRYS